MKRFAAAIRMRCALLLTVAGTATAWAAPPTDSIDQRVLPCLSCHGERRVDLQEGYVPYLYGKPAGYLYNQLINYREARRRHRTMEYMVGHLSDEYLWEIARYFAERDLPYPAPAGEPVSEAQRARGRQLVREGDPARDIPACQSCHGERLTGVQPNTPSLLGLPRIYLMAQLGAWRVGTRRAAAPDCMHVIAERLSPQDVQAVAAWLAAQPVPADHAPAAEPVAEPPLECGSVALPRP